MRLGGAGAGGRSAEALAPGDRRPELVDSGAARTPQSSPRARHLANPAAAPAVRASAATGSRARPEAGNCGWRDAVQTPASSSARPAPRSAPLRSGGGLEAPWRGSAAWAAASSPPRRPRSWKAEYPCHPSACRSLRGPDTARALAGRLRPGELRARPPQASAHCDASKRELVATRAAGRRAAQPGRVVLPRPGPHPLQLARHSHHSSWKVRL